MILLSYGVTKSGSTLAFELAKGVLVNNGFVQDKLPHNLVTPGRINFLRERWLLVRQQIEQLVSYELHQPGIRVEMSRASRSEPISHQRAANPGGQKAIAVKTHAYLHPGLVPYLEQLIQRGALLLQVIYRDPRDICLSLLDAGERSRRAGRQQFSEIVTLDDAIALVTRQLKGLRVWGSIKGASFYDYHEVAFETDKTIERMAENLRLLPKKNAVKRRLSRVPTQKNMARPNRHQDEMTPEQNQRCLDRFGSFIEDVILEKNLAWFSASEVAAQQATATPSSPLAKAG